MSMEDKLSFEQIKTLLYSILGALENMWIQREALLEALHKASFTPEQIKAITDGALNDPALRLRSRQVYAQMRENLETAARSAAIEDLLKAPPKLDKLN